MSSVYINIPEYLNKIIRIFNHFGQMAMSHFFYLVPGFVVWLVSSRHIGHFVGIPP